MPYVIHCDDISPMIVPPACQGQIVTVSYGHTAEGEGVRRTYDASNGTSFWEICDLADCGHDGECDCYDPASREPGASFHWRPLRVER